MPGVGATETGRGQTELFGDEPKRMWSCGTRVPPSWLTRSGLECPTIEGDSPVGEGQKGDGGYPEYRCLVWQRESG